MRQPFYSRFFGSSFPELNVSTSSFYKTWTGLETQQFQNLLHSLQCPPDEKHRVLLALTLIKFRKNLSFEDLASLSGWSYGTVNRGYHYCLDLLTNDFVPGNLGFGHINRDQAEQHHTIIAKDLFNVPDSAVIVIADGTYFYQQKSTNHSYARKSFSSHKGENLIKPFIICLPNGYIIDIDGENNAIDNDAKILRKILSTNTEASQFFHNGDVFILDRGFRDCIPLLKMVI